jgi:hypothetical protein
MIVLCCLLSLAEGGCRSDSSQVAPTSLQVFTTATAAASQAQPVEIRPSDTFPAEETIPRLPIKTPTPLEPWFDRDIFAEGLGSTERSSLTELEGRTLYRIELSVAEDLLSLQGVESVYYTNRENQALERIYFYLHPNRAGGEASVFNLIVDGEPVEIEYLLDRLVASVLLNDLVQPGETIRIEFDFSVRMAQEMSGNYGLFGYFEDVLLLDEFYPFIPVYDEQGWHAQTPSPNGDVTYNDASFFEVKVSLPSDLVVVASGIETGRLVEGEVQTLTFASGPARDFYMAASRRFARISVKSGETMINSYTFAEYEDPARLALETARRALEIFNQRFGPYPYTELDVLSTPMQALGMEYPGVVDIGLSLYESQSTTPSASNTMMLEATVVHEVAHQWFYNLVGNDQQGQPWLDEAMAQYAVSLYYREVYGEAEEQIIEDSWRRRWSVVNFEEIPIGQPAGAYSSLEYSAIVYGRGPIFVSTLADSMGDENFGAFLVDYIDTYRWRVVDAEDYRELAEVTCSCDLSGLFEEWVED